MKTRVGKKYIVEILTPRGLGAGHIVRVYRKQLFFRRRLSSDWFLDRGEAERFARKTAEDLEFQESGALLHPSAPR